MSSQSILRYLAILWCLQLVLAIYSSILSVSVYVHLFFPIKHVPILPSHTTPEISRNIQINCGPNIEMQYVSCKRSKNGKWLESINEEHGLLQVRYDALHLVAWLILGVMWMFAIHGTPNSQNPELLPIYQPKYDQTRIVKLVQVISVKESNRYKSSSFIFVQQSSY